MQAPLIFAIDNRLPEILDRVRQLFPRAAQRSSRPPIEQLLYGIVAQDLSASAATALYWRLRQAYPQLTVLRDADPSDIRAHLIGVPAAELKAKALLTVLKRIEQAFGSLSLDDLEKMPTDQALRFLLQLPRVTEDIASAVIRFSGNGRVVLSLDVDAARPLRRLGLCEPGAPQSALARQLIERSPAHWRGPDFASVGQGLSRIADRYCHRAKPDCDACPLRTLCPAALQLDTRKPKVVPFPTRFRERMEIKRDQSALPSSMPSAAPRGGCDIGSSPDVFEPTTGAN